jgi:hypothetical protein
MSTLVKKETKKRKVPQIVQHKTALLVFMRDQPLLSVQTICESLPCFTDPAQVHKALRELKLSHAFDIPMADTQEGRIRSCRYGLSPADKSRAKTITVNDLRSARARTMATSTERVMACVKTGLTVQEIANKINRTELSVEKIMIQLKAQGTVVNCSPKAATRSLYRRMTECPWQSDFLAA